MSDEEPLLGARAREPQRWATPVLALVSVLFFAGTIYGWTPMQAMLVQRGAFGGGGGEAQADALALVYTVASFVNGISSVFTGAFVDERGAEPAVVAAGGLYVVGYLLIACFETLGDWSLYVAFACLGAGGIGFYLSAFAAAVLVEPRYRILYLTACSGLYDSSSGVFLLVRARVTRATKTFEALTSVGPRRRPRRLL